ncbi:c-type cytochrome [Polynucleobacter kasalickyi]|uniref:Cytochrome c n=1 Tax=Polynucleobacter kasalickyi TaxID=1938817 RepID=A0A1W1Z022_9BURK|nr:cytochrome c [Polynucleobacter kasalickyi]SMC41789.1 cytochrome c [Polynucleobacter kasalickyi]
MRIYKKSVLSLFILGSMIACSTSTVKQSPHLGQAMTASDIKKVDISIGPDGVGLPVGSGNAKTGLKVYEAQCLSCHGAKGQGKPVDALVGGIGSLSSDKPVRTVGSFWPHASTLFDYTRRAMPLQSPKSLTNNEVYAVSAYILFLNGIISEDYELNQGNLAQVKMPNRDGMIDFSKEKSVVYK